MGNSESSSQLPSREHDGNQGYNRGGENKKPAEDKEDSSSSVGTALKVGAAVAGTALFALSAWSLASSSASDDHDDGHDSKEKYKLEARRFGGGGDLGGGDSILLEGYQRPRGPRSNFYSPGTSTKIKIMTYNVWLRQDVEVIERMKAIGQLIQQHSPDIIFFQEVTRPIYEIFQSSEWLEEYKYLVSPEDIGKPCCVLLSKFPVKESNRVSIESSTSCWGVIEVGLGRKLVAATAHFKSPNRREATHSATRIAQAKVSLDFLDGFPNVVFGGDMNWNEEWDGPFPLPDGWVDAWEDLRPGEDGWTFDTKSNPMLKGHRKLQKRLDRFICKLKDFKLVWVEKIGTEPIPDVSCKNVKRMVPALPSDHYGLLLTMSL